MKIPARILCHSRHVHTIIYCTRNRSTMITRGDSSEIPRRRPPCIFCGACYAVWHRHRQVHHLGIAGRINTPVQPRDDDGAVKMQQPAYGRCSPPQQGGRSIRLGAAGLMLSFSKNRQPPIGWGFYSWRCGSIISTIVRIISKSRCMTAMSSRCKAKRVKVRNHQSFL